MVFQRVFHVVCRLGLLDHRIHTRFQILNQDSAILVSHAVKIVRPVLNLRDFESCSGDVNIVIRIVFQNFQPRFFRIGEHKTRRFIRIQLDRPNCIINQIAVNGQ
ncbi:hypothetical protein D3Z48_08270 [Clostridiaceae bacterium]|nr:hypothetical protein [Clostridiaceae bacterium]